MRKTRKGIVAAIAAVSSLALMLTGCSEGTNTGTGGGSIDAAHSVGAMSDFKVGTTFKATEPVEISLLYRDHPNYPVKNDWLIFKALQANQNITFKRTEIPLSDWQTKRGLIVAGGDAPQVMPVFYSGEETAYVASGALLPISDYVQYMPNFSKILKDWNLEDYLNTKKQEDGKYYQLPGLMEISKVQYSIIVRDDVWAKAGLTDDPKDMAGLKDALLKMKATGMCGTLGLSAANDAKDILQAFQNGYNTQAGDWAWQSGSAMWDGSKYVFSGTQDGYKDLLTYMADLVSSGAMDPESMTQSTTNSDQAIAKFVGGQSCAITGNDQNANNFQDQLKGNGVNTTVHMLRIPAGPYGDYIQGGTRFSSGLIFSAKLADDPHFKAILQLVDWLYFSEEGIEFAQWGVQCKAGETSSATCTYTKAADGTRKLMPDVNNSQGLNPGEGRKMLNIDYGFSNGVFWPANGSYKDLMLSYYSPIMQDFSNKMADKKELPTPPNTPMDQDTLEQVNGYYTTLRTMENENLVKFVLGQRPMSDWDKYVSEMKAAGSEEYIKIFNDHIK